MCEIEKSRNEKLMKELKTKSNTENVGDDVMKRLTEENTALKNKLMTMQNTELSRLPEMINELKMKETLVLFHI